MNCDRCGTETDKTYTTTMEDDRGDQITKQLCWDCDHDIMNGGDFFADSGDVIQDRLERAYEYDPINNPRPW